MALTAILVEATPYLLKYLLQAASGCQSVSSPTIVGNLTIPNARGPSPDLATDALAGSAMGGQGADTLQAIINVRRNGYKFLPAGTLLGSGLARALLNSDKLGGNPPGTFLKNVMTCEMHISARAGNNASITRQPRVAQVNVSAAPSHWLVDASIDASTNPVVLVKLDRISESTSPQIAYLTIRCRHSYDW